MSIKWKIQQYNREEEIEKSLSSNLVSDDFIFYDYKNNIDVTGLLVRRADMLVIDKNMKFWGLVEVETSNHSFSNHIFPQLLGLNQLIETNNYRLAEDVLKKYEDLTHAQRRLIKFNRPFLFLVVDSDFEMYKKICNSFCSIISIQRFISTDFQFAYRFNVTLERMLQLSFCYAILDTNVISISNPELINLKDNVGDVYNFCIGEDVVISKSLGRSHERLLNHYPSVFAVLRNESRITQGKYFVKLVDDKSYVLSKALF
jgi:hypothetical protein